MAFDGLPSQLVSHQDLWDMAMWTVEMEANNSAQQKLLTAQTGNLHKRPPLKIRGV